MRGLRKGAICLGTVMILGMLAIVAQAENPPVFVTKWGADQFNQPHGVAVDTSGNIYVADTWNYRVQKFTNAGGYLVQWGSFGANNGEFKGAYGIGVIGNYVYVADTWNHRIQKFSNVGGYLAQWGTYGTGNGQFEEPHGVAVDSSGNIYVADTVNHRVQKFIAKGQYWTQMGTYGTGNGQFNTPRGVAIDASGNIYIADTNNHRVQKLTSSDGILYTYLTQWGSSGTGNGQFNEPFSLSVNDAGTVVYVADSKNHRIQKFTSSDGITYTYATQWGSFGTGDGQFNEPRSVAVDINGNIFVADTLNHRIQKFTYNLNNYLLWTK